MANPTVIACPKGVWTPIALGVEIGQFTLLETRASYRTTYRMAGDPAPAPASADDSPKIQTLTVDIRAPEAAPIDVYVWTIPGNTPDGKVVVSI